MRNIKDTMVIINTESNHTKIETLVEIQIMRAAKSADILNDVIRGTYIQATTTYWYKSNSQSGEF